MKSRFLRYFTVLLIPTFRIVFLALLDPLLFSCMMHIQNKNLSYIFPIISLRGKTSVVKPFTEEEDKFDLVKNTLET